MSEGGDLLKTSDCSAGTQPVAAGFPDFTWGPTTQVLHTLVHLVGNNRDAITRATVYLLPAVTR